MSIKIISKSIQEFNKAEQVLATIGKDDLICQFESIECLVTDTFRLSRELYGLSTVAMMLPSTFTVKEVKTTPSVVYTKEGEETVYDIHVVGNVKNAEMGAKTCVIFRYTGAKSPILGIQFQTEQ